MRQRARGMILSAIAGTMMLAPVGTASAASLGPSTSPTVQACSTSNPSQAGGKAEINVCSTSNGGRKVRGWVNDTRADGMCAYIVAYFHDRDNLLIGDKQSRKACPKGEIETFSFTGPSGTVSAEGTLYVST